MNGVGWRERELAAFVVTRFEQVTAVHGGRGNSEPVGARVEHRGDGGVSGTLLVCE